MATVARSETVATRDPRAHPRPSPVRLRGAPARWLTVSDTVYDSRHPPRKADLVNVLPIQEHSLAPPGPASSCSATTSTGAFRESVAGGTFETLNPTTNEVLADGRRRAAPPTIDAAVARGAARVRRGAVAAAWPPRERAAVLRRIAALMREHAQEFIEHEVLDIGMPIAQMGGLAARAAAKLRLLRGRRSASCTAAVPGRRRVHQLHRAQAGRGRRADHAVERAADALDLADRAGARRGEHGRPQAGGVVAADRDAARAGARAGRAAARGLQRRPGLRRDRRRAARPRIPASTWSSSPARPRPAA